MEFLYGPWHWAFSGFMIVCTMFCLIFLGQKFGVSSSYRAICSAVGASKKINYFNYDWKSHDWLLLFVVGSIIGGFIASKFMANPEAMVLGQTTVEYLNGLNLQQPGAGSMAPEEIFGLQNLVQIKNLIILIGGGVLIGFGTRYAGGCTSGHAITGLSNLQLPSLVAVMGFFIGGLTMTYFLLPLILNG